MISIFTKTKKGGDYRDRLRCYLGGRGGDTRLGQYWPSLGKLNKCRLSVLDVQIVRMAQKDVSTKNSDGGGVGPG